MLNLVLKYFTSGTWYELTNFGTRQDFETTFNRLQTFVADRFSRMLLTCFKKTVLFSEILRGGVSSIAKISNFLQLYLKKFYVCDR